MSNSLASRSSCYAMRDGDDSVFGHFPASVGNTRLGYACEVNIERCDDYDDRVLDIFGVPMRRGDLVQHISGLDRYGQKSHGAHVYELGMVREKWAGRDNLEPSAIVLDFYERHTPGAKLHIAQWAPADGYMTCLGLRKIMGCEYPFSAQDVIVRIEEKREKQCWSLLGKEQHTRAVTRWLEGMVGVSNVAAGAPPSLRYGVNAGCVLQRVRGKRQAWRWQWKEPE